MADRDGANGCADESWASETGCLHLRVPCVLHMCHTVCGAGMLLFEYLISGVLAFELVMKQGHHLLQFFDILVNTLWQLAEVHVDETPPPLSAPHRVRQRQIWKLLFGETDVGKRHCFILDANLVGDIMEEKIPV